MSVNKEAGSEESEGARRRTTLAASTKRRGRCRSTQQATPKQGTGASRGSIRRRRWKCGSDARRRRKLRVAYCTYRADRGAEFVRRDVDDLDQRIAHVAHPRQLRVHSETGKQSECVTKPRRKRLGKLMAGRRVNSTQESTTEANQEKATITEDTGPPNKSGNQADE